jgi:hypothetical protein
MTQLDFRAWRRSGVYALATSTVGGRRRGELQVTVADRADPGSAVPGSVPFRIMGPADVDGFEPSAVAGVMPPHGTPDAEETKCPHVDFTALDLPWRYTPQGVGADDRLRPWIVLLVGTDAEIALSGDGTVTVASSVLAAHPLAESWAWAHCDESAGRNVSRLLSRRDLLPDTEYLAVVVPAFDAAGADSWTAGQTQAATLPAYHHWRFQTGAEGDFATLAARLEPGFADPELGRAPVTYDRVDPEAVLEIRGALAPIGGTDAPLPDDVADDVEQLLQPLADPRGRPVVTLPVYGAAWLGDTSAATWAQSLGGDPRHRGVGGLGLWAAIRLQQQIADAAAAQAGALEAAAARIRNLVQGLQGAGSLWRRRLPTDPLHRLVVFGAAFDRIVTGSGTIGARLDAPERPLPASLFSSAGRRILRAGPARARLAATGALDPAAILEAANTCPPPPERTPDGLPHADLLDRSFDKRLRLLAEERPKPEGILQQLAKTDMSMLSEPVQKLVRSLIAEIERAALEGRPIPYGGLLALLALLGRREPRPTDEEVRALMKRLPREGLDDGASLADLAGFLLTDDRVPPCSPVDLATLASGLAEAIDPTGPAPFAVTQVLATIDGLDGPPLAPPQAAPDIDMSFWRLLRDERPDWLLPGADQLEPDGVVAVETNPVFVDAFLVGANTQTLGELRWRNIPMPSGWTPLRSFWDRIDGEVRERDVVPIADWTDASELGAAGHQTPSASSTDLVLVFRSPLFHRYPSTLVYLFPPVLDGGEPDWDADPDFAAGGASLPIFQGALGGELTFFAFDVSPAAARELWVVLEEVPSGYRFRNTAHPGWSPAELARFQAPDHSADLADVAFADPTRVLIRGDSLVPEV